MENYVDESDKSDEVSLDKGDVCGRMQVQPKTIN